MTLRRVAAKSVWFFTNKLSLSQRRTMIWQSRLQEGSHILPVVCSSLGRVMQLLCNPSMFWEVLQSMRESIQHFVTASNVTSANSQRNALVVFSCFDMMSFLGIKHFKKTTTDEYINTHTHVCVLACVHKLRLARWDKAKKIAMWKNAVTVDDMINAVPESRWCWYKSDLDFCVVGVDTAWVHLWVKHLVQI